MEEAKSRLLAMLDAAQHLSSFTDEDYESTDSHSTPPTMFSSQSQQPNNTTDGPNGGANTSAPRAPQQTQPQTHERSGYTWTRDEDAPGHAWRGKKGHDEMRRAWELISEPDDVVGGKYGDPALIAPLGTPWEKIL